jgi:hypothetical protein
MVYFIPMPPLASYAVAPLFRAIFKIITDFTGSPVLRLPVFLGGSYYMFCLASSQVSVFAAISIYNNYATAPEGSSKLDESLLWTGAIALSGTWICTFLFFVFRVAVPRYRYTLWSSTTGSQYLQGVFLAGESDKDKFRVFGYNLLLWESDIGNEVKAWTAENWARWKEEKPAWFKPEKVPDRFIPAAELEQLGYNRMRRGSAAGSVRESFREGGEEE